MITSLLYQQHDLVDDDDDDDGVQISFAWQSEVITRSKSVARILFKYASAWMLILDHNRSSVFKARINYYYGLHRWPSISP